MVRPQAFLSRSSSSRSTCDNATRITARLQQKTPGVFPPRSVRFSGIQSGIEVPLDAEHARLPALVFEAQHTTEGRVDPLVHHVDAQIEVGHRVPDRTRADLRQRPVRTSGVADNAASCRPERRESCAGNCLSLPHGFDITTAVGYVIINLIELHDWLMAGSSREGTTATFNDTRPPRHGGIGHGGAANRDGGALLPFPIPARPPVLLIAQPSCVSGPFGSRYDPGDAEKALGRMVCAFGLL